MVQRSVIILSLTCLLLFTGLGVADEGMWPIYSLDKLPFDSLHARGLQLTPEQIYSAKGGGLADAVIQCGATASFVSADGLIITNHHVAYGAIQEQSTPEHNYLRDGYYAATRADEMEARGYTATLTVGIEDVTKRVLGAVNDKMTGIKRFDAIDKVIKQITTETEKTGGVSWSLDSAAW